jgi:hypothetical protein
MASERILVVGKIEHGVIMTKHAQIDAMLTDEQLAEIDRHEAALDGELQRFIDAAAELEPPTREARQDEAAFLADTARYYEWLKAEREDYADYVADIDWLRGGC